MQLGSCAAMAVGITSATALIQPLVWELPYAAGTAVFFLKKKKKAGMVGFVYFRA